MRPFVFTFKPRGAYMRPLQVLTRSMPLPFPHTPKGGIMPAKIEKLSLPGTFRFRGDPAAPGF